MYFIIWGALGASSIQERLIIARIRYVICTPDYKDKKIETEKAKTYNTPFLSLKRPDFKYVIFKIVEVSPRNPPAKQHSRFGLIPPNVGRIGCAG